MIEGRLQYNHSNDRYGIVGADDLWKYDGLHCGTCLNVRLGESWLAARIEYGWERQEWYLVGDEEKALNIPLSNLFVRMI